MQKCMNIFVVGMLSLLVLWSRVYREFLVCAKEGGGGKRGGGKEGGGRGGGKGRRNLEGGKGLV